jgi:3-hydroxybutyryl-CoA dehydrogenase
MKEEDAMPINKVTVLGCGLMGSGIAQVCAQAGRDVTVIEVSEAYLNGGLSNIAKQLAKMVEKTKITADERDQTIERLRGSIKLEDAAAADIVIEAIIENIEEKNKTYSRLDKICPPQTIFASNTSSLSITQMMTAANPERQRRFIGMHFFNPVPIMKLVEVVRTILTDPDVFDAATRFAREIGKVPVQTSDRTGFIVNRLLVPYMLDAIRALEEGVASIVDIDNAMKLGCGYPMGPFTLGDFVGLDTTYYIANIMFDEFKEQRFAPPPLLKRMVMAGLYGRKSGRGFYDYSDANNPKPMSLS